MKVRAVALHDDDEGDWVGLQMGRMGRFVALFALPVLLWNIPGVSRANDVSKDEPSTDGEALSFDNDFLSMSDGASGGGARHVDLSYFAHRGGMMPGEYQVLVKVNDRVVEDAIKLSFRTWSDHPGRLYACVNADMLSRWGVKNTGVRSDEVDGCPVGGVKTLVSWATEKFDYNKRELLLTVPQAALTSTALMRTSPSRWDEGIPAVLVNYNYSGSQQQRTSGQGGVSQFLNLNGQLNVRGWRVRSGFSWQQSQGQGAWGYQDVYAQHDYQILRGGQFSIGALTSDGGSVDSVLFTGVKVASDAGMLDPALNSYRPAITGIADSPSTVTVYQYGRVIYLQNVPQGPFSLTDYNRSGNGDIDVEVRGADGAVRHFTMASATMPQLMGAGEVGYSLSAGRFRNGAGYLSPDFVQANLSYGLGDNNSLLTGVLLSQNYQVVSLGGGRYSALLGAFALTSSFSVTQMSLLPGGHGTQSGMAHQFSWSRNLGETSFSLGITRYGEQGYRSFNSAQSMMQMPVGSSDDQPDMGYQLLLSRSLGGWGSISLSGNQTNYRGGQSPSRNYSLGYNTQVGDVGVGVSANYNMYGAWRPESDGRRESELRNDRSVTLSLSLPLSKWLGGRNISANYMYSESNGSVNQQTGLSGSALDGRASYAVSQGWGASKDRNLSLGYTAQYATLIAGYGTSSGGNTLTYGMNGGFVLHPRGMTLARQVSLDGANALVEMPGLSGIDVGGVETDWRGYALLSSLTPYDVNKVNINTSDIPGDVELAVNSQSVVPTRGAVNRVRFNGKQGYRVMFSLIPPLDKSIPFGASASLVEGNGSLQGVVGDDGQTYLSGLPSEGLLKVKWSEAADGSCMAPFRLLPNADRKQLQQLTTTCR